MMANLGLYASLFVACAQFGGQVAAGEIVHDVATSAAPMVRFEAVVERTKTAMMSNPAAALSMAAEAGRLARGLPVGLREMSIATSEWLRGEALERLNRYSQAQVATEKAMTVAKTAPDSELYANLLMLRAALVGGAGQLDLASDHLEQARAIFRRTANRRKEAIALQSLGSLRGELGDYGGQLEHYTAARAIYDDDPLLTLLANNNIGDALKALGRYAEAEAAFSEALAIARATENTFLEARVLTNLAHAQARRGALADARKNADTSLQLLRGNEAEGWQPFIFGVKAEIAFGAGEIGPAVDFIGRTFERVDLSKSTLPYLEFHATAARIYEHIGDHRQARAHAAAQQRLLSLRSTPIGMQP